MKFIIERADSAWDRENDPPCEGAFKDGHRWAIDIESLEDLCALSLRVDERLIVTAEKSGERSIEIYDDCIE